MTIKITHRRDKDGKNILFRTIHGELISAQIASRIRAGEVFVGDTSTRVHSVHDDLNYVRSNSNNAGRDDLDNLPLF